MSILFLLSNLFSAQYRSQQIKYYFFYSAGSLLLINSENLQLSWNVWNVWNVFG